MEDQDTLRRAMGLSDLDSANDVIVNKKETSESGFKNHYSW